MSPVIDLLQELFEDYNIHTQLAGPIVVEDGAKSNTLLVRQPMRSLYT